MPKIKIKTNIKKINALLKKLPFLLGDYAFFAFIGFVVAAAVLGGFMFYKYSFLPERAVPKNVESPIKFNKELYQKVLDRWDERQEEFKKIDSKTRLNHYRNPFKKSVSVSSSEPLTE